MKSKERAFLFFSSFTTRIKRKDECKPESKTPA